MASVVEGLGGAGMRRTATERQASTTLMPPSAAGASDSRTTATRHIRPHTRASKR